MTFCYSLLVIVSCSAGLLSQESVVDIAVSLGLNKLAIAINDTGLYQEWAIDDEAKLNLFGPTDEAFTEAEDAGIIPDNLDEFRSMLTYHAISVTSHGLITLDKINNDAVIETVNSGDSMRFNVYENPGHKAFRVNGARIDESRPDNMASNGLVQVIDKVLTLSLYNVYTLLQNNEDFTTLLSAVDLTDLASTLNGDGNFTVFAPNNDAFEKIPEDVLSDVFADKDKLTDTLLYHIIGSTYYNVGLHSGIQLTTMQGDNIFISKEGNNVQINGVSSVIYADVTVTNGVVHIIDTVLGPSRATSCIGTTLWNLMLTIITVTAIVTS